MDLKFKPAALDDLEHLSEPAKNEIFTALEEFQKEQFSHSDIKQIKDDGGWIWRLKVKGEHTDHRVFIDYIEQEFQVLQILHRDNTYKN